MTGRRKWIGWAVVALVVACCIPFWPRNLGGRTTYVTTHGTSMLPRFHPGDLAVVQPASAYKVGEIVAYHSATLDNAVVMHRIVSIEGDRYTFKGDNNDFIDPDTPTAAELVGALRARIPRGGAIREWLVRPIILIPLLALTVLAIAATATRRKKRRRGGASVGYRIPTLTGASERERLRTVAPLAALLAAGGCLIAAVGVWNMPRAQTTTHRVAYEQQAILGYSGTAPAGAAYADGKIRTGDPVFTKLVHRVDVDFSYDFTSAGASDRADGSYDIVADISSATGWHRELVLIAKQPFAGARLNLSAPLDLRDVRALQARFNEETGLSTNALSLEVAARMHVSREVDGAPVESDLAPKLAFQLTSVEMMPVVSPGSTNTVPGTAAAVSKNGSVAAAGLGPAELTLWKVHLPAAVARVVAILLIAAALAAGAVVLAADRRRAARGDLANLLARYSQLLIEVDELPGGDGRPMVKVASMRALARLARGYDAPILHAEAGGTHRFVLLTDGGAGYSYEVRPAPPARLRPVVASA